MKDKIEINGVEYIRADAVKTQAQSVDGMEYCVVRTYSAGVHIGYVKSHEGQNAVLVNSRRLWSWSGAASLSQVAMEGCQSEKFAVVLPVIRLTDVIEVIPCSDTAVKCLEKIPEWKC